MFFYQGSFISNWSVGWYQWLAPEAPLGQLIEHVRCNEIFSLCTSHITLDVRVVTNHILMSRFCWCFPCFVYDELIHWVIWLINTRCDDDSIRSSFSFLFLRTRAFARIRAFKTLQLNMVDLFMPKDTEYWMPNLFDMFRTSPWPLLMNIMSFFRRVSAAETHVMK